MPSPGDFKHREGSELRESCWGCPYCLCGSSSGQAEGFAFDFQPYLDFLSERIP